MYIYTWEKTRGDRMIDNLKKAFIELTNICVKYLPTIQFLLLIIVFIISLLFKSIGDSISVMITLLCFIGIEFFVMSCGYLERILKKVNKVDISKFRILYADQETKEKLFSSAKHDIVVIGFSLSSLAGFCRQLRDLSPKIEISLCNVDPEYLSTVGNAYEIMNCKNLVDFNLAYRNYYKNIYEKLKKSRKKIKGYCVKSLLPSTYIAIDFYKKTNESTILVEQYTAEEIKDIAFWVRPDCKQYHIYHKQIEYIIK